VGWPDSNHDIGSRAEHQSTGENQPDQTSTKHNFSFPAGNKPAFRVECRAGSKQKRAVTHCGVTAHDALRILPLDSGARRDVNLSKIEQSGIQNPVSINQLTYAAPRRRVLTISPGAASFPHAR